jgi:hypothetical protein
MHSAERKKFLHRARQTVSTKMLSVKQLHKQNVAYLCFVRAFDETHEFAHAVTCEQNKRR